jgi:hypothetical protein
MELSMNLYKYSELEPIMTFISEKKLELSDNEENKKLPIKDKIPIKQMLRAIFISKIINKNINLKELDYFVKTMNSRINTEEILDDEYFFSSMISDSYPKNSKIRMPIFDQFDIFYLFYK